MLYSGSKKIQKYILISIYFSKKNTKIYVKYKIIIKLHPHRKILPITIIFSSFAPAYLQKKKGPHYNSSTTCASVQKKKATN
jgi:hypothetical protein